MTENATETTETTETTEAPELTAEQEDVLEDGVAFARVSKYPARIKCALLAWMAWRDATDQALSSSSGGGSAA